MNVEELMARDVQTCAPYDSLDRAAQIMWECDCGSVPVVEAVDGRGRVVGMITDRDICMAAYTQGRPLSEIGVGSVMARVVHACRKTDPIEEALQIMRRCQVHRVPVLDENDRLVGLLALADVAREAARERGRRRRQVSDGTLAGVLEAISRPRQEGAEAAA